MTRLKIIFSILIIVLLFFTECKKTEASFVVVSPDNNISVKFAISNNGEPMYIVKHKNKTVIDTSFISFDFKELPSLKDNFKIVSTTSGSFDENWNMPWGEQLTVKNHYNELIINLEEQTDDKRKLNIHFKIYNDGVGFRYEFPRQDNLDEVLITDENTQFNLKACDKEQLGLFAAKIRAWRPPEPYKGKGIIYEGEIVRRKAGKSGKK